MAATARTTPGRDRAAPGAAEGKPPGSRRKPPEAPPPQEFVLRLYVTGMTIRSRQAIANIKKLCEEHLAGRYKLEIVDLYERPYLAKGEQIIATPTLIKVLPAPLRRFIGNLSNTERVLLGLDLKAVKKR